MYLEFIFTTFNWFNICVSFPSASSHFFWLPNWQQSSQILNIRIKKLELYTVVLMVSNYLCHHCLQSNWKEKDHYTEPTLTLACSPWLAILNGNKKGIRSSVDHNVSSNFERSNGFTFNLWTISNKFTDVGNDTECGNVELRCRRYKITPWRLKLSARHLLAVVAKCDKNKNFEKPLSAVW